MRIFIERPIATAMVFMALLFLGAYSFLNIPLELAPKEDYPRLDIISVWPGAPPEIIQTQITSPIEGKALTVKGVRKIESSSRIGNSLITLEFDEKTNMEFARLALREKIAELKDELPYGVQPSVEPFVPEDFRVSPALSYTISGNYSLQELRELLKEKIEMGIGSIKGVASVEVAGGSESEIRIILNQEKMKALNVQPYLVQYSLSQRMKIYPTGIAKLGNRELLFKLSNSVSDISELGETVIMYSGKNPVKLKDISDMVPAYGDVFSINRINGQPTLRVTIQKEKGLSSLKVAKRVKKRLETIRKELPSDLIFRVVDDESQEIQKSLRELYLLAAIMIGVIFVLIFWGLRSVKPSLLVLSSIAFSVLLTFNLVYLFKISLNMFTLGGLALGFGLFVDNSIVVFENVLRIREKGTPAIQAAIQGSREVFLPVFASTLTTMSVFFGIAYFQGRLRLYYLPMAIVISSALAASLLVSFSVIPALTPKLLKSKRTKKTRGDWNLYERILRFLLRYPLEVLLIVAAIFFGTYKWFRAEVSLGEFFRWYSKERLYVSIGMPAGTEIERTDEVIKKFEERALEKRYEKEVNTMVSPERAAMIITFPPEIETSYLPFILKEELIQLATNFAGLSVHISGFDPQGYFSSFGSGTFYDSRIVFYGYNLKKLREITSGFERTLKRNPRIKEVKITSSKYWWWRGDSFEYILKVNKEALRKYDIDPLYFYYQIQTLIPGRFSRPLKGRIAGQEKDFSIKFPIAENTDLKELQEALIQTRKGEYLRLAEISTLEEKPIAGSIDREDQQFQQTVMWEFRGPYKAGERYRTTLYERLQLPPGFSATMDDERFLTEEEKGQIKFAIVFSLMIIYMILASLYESIIQPFFILLAVPLALIGVFVAFVIADFPFDSSAYIGVILLGGIVVNNSILLVDHMNSERRKGLSLREAVINGAKERVRPILLTAGTTVLGMLPLILIQLEEGKKQIWASLALSTVGGLISSTIFILVVIPVFYFYGDGIRFWFLNRVLVKQ